MAEEKRFNQTAVGGSLQFGKGGPKAVATGNGLEIQKPDGNLQTLMVADPISRDHAATKRYVDLRAVRVAFGFDGATPPAAGAHTGKYMVVGKAGGGWAMGELAYDNGAVLEKVVAEDGRELIVTVAIVIAGGLSLDADSQYLWDGDNTVWVKTGDIGNVTGGLRVIRVPFGLTNVDSATQIPAGARVVSCKVEVTAVYDATATIAVGTSASPTAFQGTAENDPQVAAQYCKEQDTSVASPAFVRITVGGTSAIGSGVATVQYTNANN